MQDEICYSDWNVCVVINTCKTVGEDNLPNNFDVVYHHENDKDSSTFVKVNITQRNDGYWPNMHWLSLKSAILLFMVPCQISQGDMHWSSAYGGAKYFAIFNVVLSGCRFLILKNSQEPPFTNMDWL